MNTWGLILLALLVSSCSSPSARRDTFAEAPTGESQQEGGDRTEDPTAFATWDEAIEYVRDTYSVESIDTSRSSWITSAEYFEADGRGYLILGMRGHPYIFSGVPADVWEEFKEAPSLGKAYHALIRGNYGFEPHVDEEDEENTPPDDGR